MAVRMCLACLLVGTSLLFAAEEDIAAAMKSATFTEAGQAKTLLVDARAETRPSAPRGPFVQLPEGGFLTVTANQIQISNDHGKTWANKPLPLPKDKTFDIRHYTLLRTKEGTLIFAFANTAEEKGRDWNGRNPPADSQLPVYAMRSTDDGKTWEPPQRIHDGWTRDVRSIIQLRSGRIVLATSKSVPDPGRQQALCIVSDDDGKSWRPSEPIDLGDFGNPRPDRGDGHDGAHNGTMVELADGRMWMLLSCRKGLGQAFSTDGGMTWKDKGPSSLRSAEFSPATLRRLNSGRLVLAWTPVIEKGDPFPHALHARIALNFSEDDGKTWSPSTVLIYDRPPPGADSREQWRGHVIRIAEVFEASPGELWVSTHRPDVRLRVFEKDLVAPPP
jgi:sialidase-1